MIQTNNKTYHYHAVVDKDDNVMFKCPSRRYAKHFVNTHPYAVAIKEVEHTINEQVVWRKENRNDIIRNPDNGNYTN